MDKIKRIHLTAQLLLAICLFHSTQYAESNETQLHFDFEYIGKAVQKRGTHVWGTSPVIGPDGRVHLYVAEWPIPRDPSVRFSGWYKESQIAHYVGDNPEGPFEFLRIAVPDLDGKFNAPHNPTVQHIDGKYVLSFIVNEIDDTSTQRIVMFVADDLNDTWVPIADGEPDGTALRLPDDPSIWSHASCRGITNPSLVKHDGRYLLFFKGVLCDSEQPSLFKLWHFGYGVASAKQLEGPYQYHPDRITPEELQLEDVAAFSLKDKVYMLSRDIRGTLGSEEGGIIWTSDDGMKFDKANTKRSFDTLASYLEEGALDGAAVYRGTTHGQLERPQLLFIDGTPRYMYVATGINDEAGYGSCSHVFKVKIIE